MELFKIEEYVEFVLQYLRLESISSDLVLKQYNLDDIVNKQCASTLKCLFALTTESLLQQYTYSL